MSDYANAYHLRGMINSIEYAIIADSDPISVRSFELFEIRAEKDSRSSLAMLE